MLGRSDVFEEEYVFLQGTCLLASTLKFLWLRLSCVNFSYIIETEKFKGNTQYVLIVLYVLISGSLSIKS